MIFNQRTVSIPGKRQCIKPHRRQVDDNAEGNRFRRLILQPRLGCSTYIRMLIHNILDQFGLDPFIRKYYIHAAIFGSGYFIQDSDKFL